MSYVLFHIKDGKEADKLREYLSAKAKSRWTDKYHLVQTFPDGYELYKFGARALYKVDKCLKIYSDAILRYTFIEINELYAISSARKQMLFSCITTSDLESFFPDPVK